MSDQSRCGLILLTSTPIKRTKKGYLLGGSINSEVLESYLEVFDDVTLIGRDVGEGDASGSIISNLRVRVVPSDCRSIGGIVRLMAWIRRESRKSNVFVVCGRLPSLEGLFGLLATPRNTVSVAEVVGDAYESVRNRSSGASRHLASTIHKATRICVRLCDGACYVTSSYLQGRYPNGGITFNCSDVNLRPFLSWEHQVRPCSDGSWRLGLIGEVATSLKGVDIAIGAVGRLVSEGWVVSLSVVGRGDVGRWQKLADSQGILPLVSFEGVLPHEKFPEWFETIDLYIQPSRQEGLPRALVEAMAIGMPCVGAEVGGIPELLTREALHATGDWQTWLVTSVRSCRVDP